MRNIILLFIVITILTSAVVGGAVYYWQLTKMNTEIRHISNRNLVTIAQLNQQIQDLQKQLADIEGNTNKQPVSISEDWLTIYKPDLGISFKYPQDYIITDYTKEAIQSLKIASPDFSSELIGEPLKAIIKGYSFYFEAWVKSDNLDLDKMIKDRLNLSSTHFLDRLS